MSRTYYGFKRAVIGIIAGLFLAPILKSILSYYGQENLIILFYISSILAIILLTKKMRYWSIWYSLGWIFGVLVLYQMLNAWELTLYIVIFIIALCYKIRYKIRKYLRI